MCHLVLFRKDLVQTDQVGRGHLGHFLHFHWLMPPSPSFNSVETLKDAETLLAASAASAAADIPGRRASVR